MPTEFILKQCKTASRKQSTLTRICKLMSLERRRVLMKYFIKSHLAYYPLVWMCCDRAPDNRLKHTNVHLGWFTVTMY